MMSEDIINVDSYDFDSRIEYGITGVLFFSQFCVRSRSLIPIIEELADQYYDSMRFLALDVEQSPDIASVFAVEATPTVIFFKNGRLKERVAGTNPPEAYAEVIDSLLTEDN